jgi:hypothetical protein
VKGEAKSAEYANEARLERMKRKHFFLGVLCSPRQVVQFVKV